MLREILKNGWVTEGYYPDMVVRRFPANKSDANSNYFMGRYNDEVSDCLDTNNDLYDAYMGSNIVADLFDVKYPRKYGNCYYSYTQPQIAEIHVSEKMAKMFVNTDCDRVIFNDVDSRDDYYYLFYLDNIDLWKIDTENTIETFPDVRSAVNGLIVLVRSDAHGLYAATSYVFNDYSITFPKVLYYHNGGMVCRDYDSGCMNEHRGDPFCHCTGATMIQNMILYFQSHPEWIERVKLPMKDPTKKMGKRRRKQIELENQHSVIHKISIPKQIKNCIRAKDFEGDHYTINKRFLVRGHWRNQVCGERNRERKLIFIAPFWKGHEDDPVIDHVYNI